MSETEVEQIEESTEPQHPEVSDLVAQNWRTLVRPRKITADASNTKDYGKFSIGPLERGYGITLGNSLIVFTLRCSNYWCSYTGCIP